MPETLTVEKWSVEDKLPDDDLLVLIWYAKDDRETDIWIGYCEGDKWYTEAGMQVQVTHWAEFPEPQLASDNR